MREKQDRNCRECACSAVGPEQVGSGLRYNPLKAADEKIPLPVVHVNNKPQYLVFPLHSAHPTAKQRHFPVETSKSPFFMRVSHSNLHRILCISATISALICHPTPAACRPKQLTCHPERPKRSAGSRRICGRLSLRSSPIHASISKPSLQVLRLQGAKPVHFTLKPVRTVDKSL